MARAFRTAGARHVLVALRDVPDRDARLFMLRFYAHLFGHPSEDPATAFAATTSELADAGDPIDWTAFILVRNR